MEVMTAVVAAQIGVVGLIFKWLHTQVRDNRIAIEKVYSKDETKEAVDLRLAPLVVSITNVQKDVTEMKQMIGRLLDEKNAK